MGLELFLEVVSGIGWIIVYEECVRLGFKQKTYAMPLFALGLNFAWEFTYSVGDIFLGFHGPLEGFGWVQACVNVAWCCIDVLILATYLLYGRKEWPKTMPSRLFAPWFVFVLVASFTLQWVFVAEFGPVMAAQYSAFLQNLLMSALFLALLARRGSSKGQSLLLACAKWIGTLAPTILMGVVVFNPVVLACGVFCSILDIGYIFLLAKRISCEKAAR